MIRPSRSEAVALVLGAIGPVLPVTSGAGT